jgi:hypothetical protein
MCDYSLEHFVSRASKVGDKLVTARFGPPLLDTQLVSVIPRWPNRRQPESK